MAISFVQAVSGTNTTGATSTTNTSAMASPTISGNSIVVGVVNNGANGSVTSVTDTAGNVYTKVSVGPTSNVTTEIWACFNIRGGASNVVTANQGFNDGAIFAHEYSSLAPKSGVLDASLWATSNSASMSVGPSSTLISSDELVFVVGEMDIVGANALSVGPGFGNFTTASSNNLRCAVQSLVVSTTSPQTATMVMTSQGGASWRITMATFRGLVSGEPSNLARYLRVGGGMSRSEGVS